MCGTFLIGHCQGRPWWLRSLVSLEARSCQTQPWCRRSARHAVAADKGTMGALRSSGWRGKSCCHTWLCIAGGPKGLIPPLSVSVCWGGAWHGDMSLLTHGPRPGGGRLVRVRKLFWGNAIRSAVILRLHWHKHTHTHRQAHKPNIQMCTYTSHMLQETPFSLSASFS